MWRYVGGVGLLLLALDMAGILQIGDSIISVLIGIGAIGLLLGK